MNREDFSIYQLGIFEQCKHLRKQGQKEYAHDEDNAFRNFETLAKELNIPREMILWIYLRKHLDGILAHINGHRSQREPVFGRIEDAIVYLTLLHGMLSEDINKSELLEDRFEPMITQDYREEGE